MRQVSASTSLGSPSGSSTRWVKKPPPCAALAAASHSAPCGRRSASTSSTPWSRHHSIRRDEMRSRSACDLEEVAAAVVMAAAEEEAEVAAEAAAEVAAEAAASPLTPRAMQMSALLLTSAKVLPTLAVSLDQPAPASAPGAPSALEGSSEKRKTTAPQPPASSLRAAPLVSLRAVTTSQTDAKKYRVPTSHGYAAPRAPSHGAGSGERPLAQSLISDPT